MRIGNAIIRDLGLTRHELMRATAHGQIKVDGEALSLNDLNIPEENVRHKCLTLWKRRTIVTALGIVEPTEQMVLL